MAITKSEHKQLLDDVEVIKVQLEEIKERIREAQSYGDLSENEEYSTAVEEQQNLAGVLNDKMTLLAESTVIEDSASEFSGVFNIGGYVTLTYNPHGKVITRVLRLGSINNTVNAGVLRVDSPLGRTILNKPEGVYKVERREGGPIYYEVRASSEEEIEEHRKTFPDKKTVLARMFDL